MASLKPTLSNTRAPSPDPSIIARDFASQDPPKRFLPRNMPDIPVKCLYLDYTLSSSSSVQLSSWFSRFRSTSAAKQEFETVRLLVLDRPHTEDGARGYAISLSSIAPHVEEDEDGKLGKEAGNLVEQFAFYTSKDESNVNFREEMQRKEVELAEPVYRNWQEEIGQTEMGGESIAREGKSVFCFEVVE